MALFISREGALLLLGMVLALVVGCGWVRFAHTVTSRFWGPLPRRKDFALVQSVLVGPLWEELWYRLPLVWAAFIFGPLSIFSIGLLVISSLVFGLTHGPMSDEQLASLKCLLDRLARKLAAVLRGPFAIAIVGLVTLIGVGEVVETCFCLKPSNWIKPEERRRKVQATLIFVGPGLVLGVLTLFAFSLLPVEVFYFETSGWRALARSYMNLGAIFCWCLFPVILVHSANNSLAVVARIRRQRGNGQMESC